MYNGYKFKEKGVIRFMDNKKLELYDLFLSYNYSDIMILFKNAKTKEEKDFYAKISDMILQREQKRVMGE